MKDAKGHGSDGRGGNIGDQLYRLMKPPSMIPGYPAHQTGVHNITDDPDAFVTRLRAGAMPDLSNVSRAPGWIERFGRAARRS